MPLHSLPGRAALPARSPALHLYAARRRQRASRARNAAPARAGPVWRPPKPKAVLRSLPFMAALPEPLFNMVFKAGEILGAREFFSPHCSRPIAPSSTGSVFAANVLGAVASGVA